MYITNFKTDEFLKSSHEPYILRKESTNLINLMLSEEGSRIDVVNQFIGNLTKFGNACLPTEFHVNWAMECIAYSFTMPMEYCSTITQSIKIYRNWLLKTKKSPRSVIRNRIPYCKEILGHFSLIFIKRKDPKKQAELCVYVLSIIQSFISKEISDMSVWECLIKLMILILNNTFKYCKDLSELVSSKLIKVFFEIWLRSNCRNNQLWQQTAECIINWIDQKWMISHWTSFTASLTEFVMRVMYLETKKTIEILFKDSSKYSGEPESLIVSLSEEQGIYFWHRLLRIMFLVDVTDPKIGIIHFEMSSSVVNIIDKILSVCYQRNSTKTLEKVTNSLPQNNVGNLIYQFQTAHNSYVDGTATIPMPSINSILDIFGFWLFYHTKSISSYEFLEKPEILSVLCRIFFKAKGPPSQGYLAAFYSVMCESFATANLRVIAEILKNSADIATLDLKTIQLLLRSGGYIKFIGIFLSDNACEPQIRNSCYKILSAFCAVPWIFQVEDIHSIILDIALDALIDESNPENFLTLIWSLSVFVSTIDDQNTVQTILCNLVDRLGTVDFKEEKQMYSTLLEAISILPLLIKSHLVSCQVAKRNIGNLLAFIPKRGKSIEEDQSSQLLIAITNWIISFPEAFTDKSLRFDIFKILENRKTIEKHRNLCDCIRNTLLNCTGKPNYEKRALNFYCATLDSMNNYSLSNNLISLYEELGTLKALIRNSSGLFVWKLRMITSINSKPHNVSVAQSITHREKILNNNPEMSKVLFEDLDPNEQKIFQVQTQFFVKEIKGKRKTEKSQKPSNKVPTKQCIQHRVLLSTMGLLDLENLNSFHPFPSRNLAQISDEIDKSIEREYIMFPVFYLANPEDRENAITNSLNSYSNEFEKFLNSLGSALTIKQNKLKYLKYKILKYEKIIYQSFELFESIVISPAIMTSTKINFAETVAMLPVIVFWNQRTSDAHSKKVPSILEKINLDNKQVIVISYANDQFSLIHVFGAKKKQGPLLNQMLIPNVHLPKLLHYTIYNFESSIKSYVNPWKCRNDLIKHKLDGRFNFESLLNYLLN